MFSGIVEEIGVVQSLKQKANLAEITVKAKKVLSGVKIGDSICVDGACLTVVSFTKADITFEAMKETLLKTTLGKFKKGSQVNLERALKANARLHGHFVTGHVDAALAVRKVIASSNYLEIQITQDKTIARYIAPKGSVTINGVSLTVGEVTKIYFSVYLIPHTKDVTNLGSLKVKDKVNVEVDILARYILNKQ